MQQILVNSASPLKAQRRGFTLTELAIVLGVIGTILAGIWTAAAMVSQSQKVDRAVRQITTIIQNIRSLYATRSSIYSTGNISVGMANSGVFPAEMIVGSTTTSCGQWSSPAANPWGGAAVVWDNGNSAVRISYYGVPAAACTQIISNLTTNYSSAGPFDYLTAAGNLVLIPSTGPLDPASVTTSCAANNTASCSSVEFDYNIK